MVILDILQVDFELHADRRDIETLHDVPYVTRHLELIEYFIDILLKFN